MSQGCYERDNVSTHVSNRNETECSTHTSPLLHNPTHTFFNEKDVIKIYFIYLYFIYLYIYILYINIYVSLQKIFKI